VGIDHDLVESSTDELLLLQSGCLCCTVRSDLILTLRARFEEREKSEIPFFDRVVIETTGLADPAPILQFLMTDDFVGKHYRLDGVLTTVDAVNGEATMDRQIEAVKQAAVADRLLLTKTDLVNDAASVAVEKRLRALNPAAPIHRVIAGDVDPALLFDIGLYNPATKSLDVQRWLDAEAYAAANDHGRHHHHDVNRHDDHIRAACLVVEEPIPGPAFDRWLSSLFHLKGPDLLRFKAIVNVAGLPGPIVIHGVQHVIHPPLMMRAWPNEDRRTRMVFITRDLDPAALQDSLDRFTREVRAA
jgi:G3E family GTPase